MKLRLIPGEQPAQDVTRIWREACEATNHTLEVLEFQQPDTRRLIERLQLNTFPALLQEERVVAVGNPTPESARRVLAGLAETTAG